MDAANENYWVEDTDLMESNGGFYDENWRDVWLAVATAQGKRHPARQSARCAQLAHRAGCRHDL
ncbi:hypothetical protein Z946_624 [Sulfitobacter noctilucicola]|nr:hypothetical protein Z946_624 [Sulfitobacter noctilucicola]